jgi:hypothetical protein
VQYLSSSIRVVSSITAAQVGGKPAGVLTSQALSRALWDIYLGPDPVSKDAKESLGLSLAAVAKL